MNKEKYRNISCPICGELPRIRLLYRPEDSRPGKWSADWNKYKVSCPNYHLDCGSWHETKMAAWKDWLKRRKDTAQPEFCFNDNIFTIRHMNTGDLADFLLRWYRDAAGLMRKYSNPEYADRSQEGEREDASTMTADSIMEWLEKPVDGLYPKGYPGIPEYLQNSDTDIYGYRKRQAKVKI